MKTIKVPDGWRPTFTKFMGEPQFDRIVQVNGGSEAWTEAETHYAMARLLEHRERVDMAIDNVRDMIAEHQNVPAQEAGSVLSLVGELRSALDASFSCVDDSNAKILGAKVDAALERADRFLGRPKG
jgi:hypothetical protein